MFDIFAERLNKVFTQLRRHTRLSETDADLAMDEVRLAIAAPLNSLTVSDMIARASLCQRAQ